MFTSTTYAFDFHSIYAYKKKFVNGFFMTVIVSFFSLILSVVIGIFLAWAQSCKIIILRLFVRFYIEIIRGTPLLVQILIFYYIFANNMGFHNRYIVGIFILAIFSGAYVCEILRSAIQSIPYSQYESAKSLGLSEFGIYTLVILPQAYKRMIPPLTGQFASIIKDSSLLSVISVNEFTMSAQEVNSYTFSTIESYIPLAIGYLLLTYPISFFSRYLEKRLKN